MTSCENKECTYGAEYRITFTVQVMYLDTKEISTRIMERYYCTKDRDQFYQEISDLQSIELLSEETI